MPSSSLSLVSSASSKQGGPILFDDVEGRQSRGQVCHLFAPRSLNVASAPPTSTNWPVVTAGPRKSRAASEPKSEPNSAACRSCW